MKKGFVLRRPSPAMAVALTALFLALGGTSYAAFSLPKNSVGTKQLRKSAVTTSKIKNGAVTASKIKNGAVTASKINTTGLTVPNALFANNATNAGHASSADTATNATNAANTADYFASGLVTLAAGNPQNTQTIVTRGPFSFVAQCLDNGGGSYTASLIVKDNSASGAIEEDDYDGNYNPPTTLNPGDTHNVFYPTTDSTPYWYGDYYNLFSVDAPGGPAFSGMGSLGTHVLGAGCAFQLVLFG